MSSPEREEQSKSIQVGTVQNSEGGIVVGGTLYDNRSTYVTQLPNPVVVGPVPRITSPVGDFTGRAGLIAEITLNLTPDSPTWNPIVVISGISGLGKTQLAYKISKELRNIYTDGQVLVEMGALPPEGVLYTVLQRALRLGNTAANVLPQDFDSLKDYYNTHLDGKKILILADNAQGINQVKILDHPPPGCALLVTYLLKKGGRIKPGLT
ncbi:MAG: hypothetical protein M3Z04_20655 [Chloroflexota bacterium]|nr:hypothetical protein [Chloroflexota bacterium]